ncbi:MAG TPA: phosphatidylglycerophosphatase A [Mucilaginibacter sp.]|jgi:phosphatidylglycerophosphatase A|nr:phosphatidylglycerophosphatase A [Mucilaginibacter sp.]
MQENKKSEIENPKSEILHKLFASVLGVGYLKGGGTIAAAVCCCCWYLAWHGAYPPVTVSILITAAVTFTGVWSSSIMEREWGKDPSKVVIDEISGMCVSLVMLPVNLKYLLAAFILFRFFDIVKPFYIQKMESFPKGWGIMLDDVLAGIYTNLLLQAVLWFKLF